MSTNNVSTITPADFPSPEAILSDSFLAKYKGREPNWGFNSLGKIVFLRTYSRIKEDGTQEQWWETVARCVRGAQEIGACYLKEEAEQLYDLVFNLKCNFAGRSLWQLGTEKVRKFGANSLVNCMVKIIKVPEDFCFIFENLMMGCGVGFSVQKENIHELPKVKHNVNIVHLETKDADFIVPDSREGWTELLRRVLNAFYVNGQAFSYSTILVRAEGSPIKGFGGTASGPKILVDGITNICKIFQSREGKKLRSIDVLDICNIIGSIVVAGNIRRSSQISLGDADDLLFMRAKRWDKGIPNWRAMSNNTIYADDYSYLTDEFWKGYDGIGEPYGLFNLNLSQTYGRLIDGPMSKSTIYPRKKDPCIGTNPCCFPITKDIHWVSLDGHTQYDLTKIKSGDVIGGPGLSNVTVKDIHFPIGDHAIYKVSHNFGSPLYLTADHKLMTNDGLLEVSQLSIGSMLRTSSETYTEITSIEFVGMSEIFCIEVSEDNLFELNGIIVSNSEISLEDGESCNLGELYLNNITSQEELTLCATLLYKTMKAICSLRYLHEITDAVVKKNFRLGVGITGICQSINKLEWLDTTYLELRKLDKKWSNKRGWPESIKLTTIKPSGTLSLLAGATPGVHPGYSEYFIRRVRMSSSDKLVSYCRDMGYHVEPQVGFDGTIDHTTVVVEFPCKFENTILAKEMTAVDQLELVKRLQTVWSDNAVSCTVYYKREELPAIKEWLKDNYESSIKSVSFLLHSEHGFKQAPYEEITKEQYLSKCEQMNTVIASYEELGGQLLEGIECEGGACPLR